MIEDAILKWGIIAIFLFTVSNGFISTPPSELVLSLAGALTIGNNRYFWFMLLGVVFSNYIGTTVLYFVNRCKGKVWYDKIYTRLCKKIPKMNKIVPSSNNLIRFFNNQEWLVFICRFLPFIRSIISAPAGISKMNFFKFTLYSLSGITIWSLIWLNVGRRMLPNITNIKISFMIIIIIITYGLGYFIKKKINIHK